MCLGFVRGGELKRKTYFLSIKCVKREEWPLGTKEEVVTPYHTNTHTPAHTQIIESIISIYTFCIITL